MKLKANKRKDKDVEDIREEGGLPAVVYGPEIDPQSIELDYHDFRSLFEEVGESKIFDLEIEDEDQQVLVHDYQIDPIEGKFIHVDLYGVAEGRKLQTKVELEFEGEAPVEERGEGIVVINFREIEIESLPKDIPDEISIDLSQLEEVGDEVRASDLDLGDEVKLLIDKDAALVSATHMRSEEELEALEEEVVEDVTEVEGVMPDEEEGEEGVEVEPSEEEEPEEVEEEIEEQEQ